MAEKSTGVLKAKAGTGKAIKIDDTWYEIINDRVKEFVATIQKPYPSVEYSYEKNGYKKVLTFIKPTGGAETSNPTEAVGQVVTGSTTKPSYTPQSGASGTNWDKRDKQIRRGNALNAAGAVLNFSEEVPTDVVVEKLRVVAEAALEWLEEGL